MSSPSSANPNLLCLACSSSLPPRLNGKDIFITECCRRPICSSCISRNPRLTRYNPCLLCLVGVDAVGPSKGKESAVHKNIDGSVRDEDMFVVGDDDDEDAGEQETDESLPAYSDLPNSDLAASGQTAVNETIEDKAKDENAPNRRAQYYIKRGDTLQGLVLKFGVNREELCRLNNLPLSTLTTTPHLLHTRTFLLLPSSARITNKENISFITEGDFSSSEEDKARAVRRARERAGKRLQTITKEVDWHIAKAYVALAEMPVAEDEIALKHKENPTRKPGNSSTLESSAIGQYLEDAEWEATELQAGRGVVIPPIPFLR